MALDNLDDAIMLSALQHYSYCPRQCALIHMEQEFSDNVHTMRGHAVHERVDAPGYDLRPGMRIERALPIWSERLGLVGRCDIVEFDSTGVPCPVEYKHGPRRVRAHDDVQLAAQALCLEEMTGKAVPRGAIYHHSARRRRDVLITDTLREMVTETVAAVRGMLKSRVLPPAVNDSRCKECSLNQICQPKAMTADSRFRALRASLFTEED
ncbi:MAG: CRISPR-associated protein Cas4 [Burkholderiales bacterium]|nr:CRISPR-associated protein Cas4 [Burkholderiales bacterium]